MLRLVKELQPLGNTLDENTSLVRLFSIRLRGQQKLDHPAKTSLRTKPAQLGRGVIGMAR